MYLTTIQKSISTEYSLTGASLKTENALCSLTFHFKTNISLSLCIKSWICSHSTRTKLFSQTWDICQKMVTEQKSASCEHRSSNGKLWEIPLQNTALTKSVCQTQETKRKKKDQPQKLPKLYHFYRLVRRWVFSLWLTSKKMI